MTTSSIIAIGRLGVDLYPFQNGVGLEDVETFGKYLGGSAANVAVAAARHGHSTTLISRVGGDPFGQYLLRELDRFGIDRQHVITDPIYKTPITFCEIFPPDDFPIYFYREPKAPDLNIDIAQLDLAAVSAAKVLWFTTTGLSQEPSRTTHFTALKHRGRMSHTVFDLDYRSVFWDGPHDATAQMAHALEYATVAVGNREECAVAVGETDPVRAADALLERGVELAIVKRGPLGVLAKTREESVVVPPYLVEVVNGLGAGDAFGGGLCHGLLEGWDIERTIRFANIAGALVASRRECSTAMPFSSEVEAILEGSY